MQQGVIKASLLGDDDSGVPCEDLVASGPRQLAAAEAGGDVDHAGLVDAGHYLRAGEHSSAGAALLLILILSISPDGPQAVSFLV